MSASLATDDRRSAIVAVRSRKRMELAQVPEMTAEEYRQRGDAADALWREMKRRIAEAKERTTRRRS